MQITSPAQIDLWRGIQSEHQRLEFKEAKAQFDNQKLYRYCVALANEGGGTLLLGIADRPPRPVVGTQAFRDPVGMAEKLFKAVGFRVEIEEVNHPDGRVLVFHIPSRPSGTAYHHEGAYLMRSGEELVPMSEDQLRKIFTEGEPHWLEQPSMRGLDSAKVVELLDTQSFFELLKLSYPTRREGVIERLIQERLIDEDSSGISIRRIGAILIAKRLSSFADVARKAARLIVYSGNSKLNTRLDWTEGSGYASSFRNFVDLIMQQLPRNEIIQDALRTEVSFLPELVVRELVANCLIHQDFTIPGASVVVDVYENRVEFTNPGTPIVPVQRFIDGYQSRNERLADIMRRMGICEEKSSGIDRVIEAAELLQLPPPEFRTGYLRTEVIVCGPRPFDEMDRAERVRACYQHCVLKLVMRERMTNLTLRSRFNLPESKSAIVSQIIAAAVSDGLIKPDESVGGSKKFARYLPVWA